MATRQQHECFLNCKDFLESDAGDGTTPMVRLTNALVNTPSQQPPRANTHKPSRAPKLRATDSRHSQATNDIDYQTTDSVTIRRYDSGMVWDDTAHQWVMPHPWAQWQQECMPGMVARHLPDYLAALPQQQPQQAWDASSSSQAPWPAMCFNQGSGSQQVFYQQYANGPLAGPGPCAPLQEPCRPGFLPAAVAVQREAEAAQREVDRRAKRLMPTPMPVPLHLSQVVRPVVFPNI